MRALALLLLTAVTLTQLGASDAPPNMQAVANAILPSTESRETVVRVGDRTFRVRVYLIRSLPGIVPVGSLPPPSLLYTTVAVQPADGKAMPSNFRTPKVTFQYGRRNYSPQLWENAYLMIWPNPNKSYSGTLNARFFGGERVPAKIELRFGSKRGTAQVEGIVVRAASPTL